jgi:iron complex outermembrane receptor protein
MRFRTAAAGMILISTGSQADTEGPSLPRVEVVGSRLPRIDAENALPVQIIRREEIERSGATTAEEVHAAQMCG